MAFCLTKFRSLRALWTLLLSAGDLRDAIKPAVPRVIEGACVSYCPTYGNGEESRLKPLNKRWEDSGENMVTGSGDSGDGNGEESMSSDISGDESDDEAMMI